MSEDAVGNAAARIDRALARIESAVQARDAAHAQLERRHAILREQVSAAIAALDAEIAEAHDG